MRSDELKVWAESIGTANYPALAKAVLALITRVEALAKALEASAPYITHTADCTFNPWSANPASDYCLCGLKARLVANRAALGKKEQ